MLAPLESYQAEMLEWKELIEKRLGADPLRVLDLGSGGGHHLYHLRQELPLSGLAVDLSAAMLQRVEALVPDFVTATGDMTRLRLGEQFDLVSVHDSFCYLTDSSQLEGLFATIAFHLKPGGLGLVKVDALSDSFQGPYRYLTTFEDDEVEVTLTHYEWDPDPFDQWLEVIYLFLERRGMQVEVREERHRLGLFSKELLLKCAANHGLRAKFHVLEPWDEDRDNLLLVLQQTAGGGKRRKER